MLARMLLRLRTVDARDAAARLTAPASAAWRQAAFTNSATAAEEGAVSAAAAAAAAGAAEGSSSPADTAELAAALAAQGLSHSAVMAVVGWHPNANRRAQQKMVERVAGLQELFGADSTNRMLVM